MSGRPGFPSIHVGLPLTPERVEELIAFAWQRVACPLCAGTAGVIHDLNEAVRYHYVCATCQRYSLTIDAPFQLKRSTVEERRRLSEFARRAVDQPPAFDADDVWHIGQRGVTLD